MRCVDVLRCNACCPTYDVAELSDTQKSMASSSEDPFAVTPVPPPTSISLSTDISFDTGVAVASSSSAASDHAGGESASGGGGDGYEFRVSHEYNQFSMTWYYNIKTKVRC